MKTGPLARRNLQVFVIPDFASSRVSRVTREQGAWPPFAGAKLRDALQVGEGRKVGDVVTVMLRRGRAELCASWARVHDVGQAQARMENAVYAYATRETLESPRRKRCSSTR